MSASAAGGLGSMGRSEAPHFAAPHESENGPERTCRRLVLMSAFRVPVQPVDATQALNLSAAVSNYKVSRGRSFS